MGKDINSILNTCFLSTAACQVFFCTENIMREKKNGQVLNRAPFCKSKQIYINLYLIGWFSGKWHGIFFFWRAHRASQNTKDTIKYLTIVLTKPSYKKFTKLTKENCDGKKKNVLQILGFSQSYSQTKELKPHRRRFASYLWQFGHESFSFDRG